MCCKITLTTDYSCFADLYMSVNIWVFHFAHQHNDYILSQEKGKQSVGAKGSLSYHRKGTFPCHRKRSPYTIVLHSLILSTKITDQLITLATKHISKGVINTTFLVNIHHTSNIVLSVGIKCKGQHCSTFSQSLIMANV